MSRYEFVYYNSTINHEPHLIFNEERDGPLIKNCQDYDMSIANFKVDLKCLPTFIPTIRYSDDDSLEATRNQTIYTITLTYCGFASTSNVYYTPQDKTNGTTPPNLKMVMPIIGQAITTYTITSSFL